MQRKENFFTDNADIRFQLTKRIDFDAFFQNMSEDEREATGCQSADEFRETTFSILETLGEICGTELGGNAAKVEAEPITLKDGEVELPPSVRSNVEKLVAVGCAGLGMLPRWGGLGLPFLLEASVSELIMRACPSTGLNMVWFSGIGHIIEKFGNDVIKEQLQPKLAAGEWSGCMALTEPDTGSDLGALTSYGEKQPDGTYRLYGTKRFITNGAGDLALVLAKNEKGAPGLHNLNLYLCMRKIEGKDNYRVTKIEEKLGLHGSATCELTFDGAHAVLLGDENKGFQHMLHLMNDARIAVAFQGVGYMEAIYRMASDFASQRKTWGKPIAQHEMIAEKLLDMEVEVKAMRSLCYQAGFNHSMIQLSERRLKDKTLSEDERLLLERQVAKSKRRVRRWTPLVKWYVAEKTVTMARDNLQLHGGYGYTKEYRAEWWVRESLILPLYEGTSQIQALMCVKDTLKDVIRQPRKFVEGALGLKVQTLRANDPLRKKLYRAKQLEQRAVIAILLRLVKENARASINEAKSLELKSRDLLRMIKMLSRDLIKMENVGPALLNAERICEIKSLVALAECLVWDAEADESRRYLAERFLNRTWPRLNMLKDEIEMDDPVIADRLSFGPSRAREEAANAHA